MPLVTPRNTWQSFAYDWDVTAGDDGTTGAVNLGDLTRNDHIGDLPADFVVVNAVFIVRTAFVGATATVEFGNTDDPNQYIASSAITVIDAAEDVIGGAVATITPRSNDAASSDVIVTVGTANLTAGAGTLVLAGYMPND